MRVVPTRKILALRSRPLSLLALQGRVTSAEIPSALPSVGVRA
jgi:hypothetical protein